MQRLLIILSFFTLSYSATALLDFSDYDVYRSKDKYYGFNPYAFGIYGGASDIDHSYFSKFKTEQRDIRWHFSTILLFNGVGVHAKQYWNKSKYKSISIFSSYSLTGFIHFPMSTNSEPEFIDAQIISSGFDFNILRFNKFDIRFAVGLMGGYSISRGEVGAAPFIYTSLLY